MPEGAVSDRVVLKVTVLVKRIVEEAVTPASSKIGPPPL